MSSLLLQKNYILLNMEELFYKMDKRIVLVLAGLILVFILLIVFWILIMDDEIKEFQKPRLKILEKGNGIVINIWMDSERFDVLKEHGIKYLFVDVGDTGQDGKIITNRRDIERFLDEVKEYEKENSYYFIILPYSEINTYNYDVDSDFENNFIKDYLEFFEMGFDGVYVDVEPVRDKESYLNFLEKIKRGFPDDAVIGVYSGAVSNRLVVFMGNEWEWRSGFYKQVADRVDFIFVPGYDSGLTSEKKYKDYIKRQIKELSSENFNCYFMMGVPTHKIGVENLENALEAYSSSENNKFIGVAVFAEWTTSDYEWGVFEEWVDSKHPFTLSII